MPRVDLKLEVEIKRTARVMQVEGLFDVPEKKRAEVEFHFDVPLEEKPWQIGLIVGPSGAGKSSVARTLFGKSLIEGYDWPANHAVVDAFGKTMPVNDVVGALSAVGFASPPGWIKPFRVLSNGERFRVNLARAIVDPRPLVAIDEFSSVVDRRVARIGSAATAKAVRARKGKQLVAVTCHEDVLDWLQPDWVLQPHVGAFSWRSPQRRPAVQLEIRRVDSSAWRLFSQHHYLTAHLHRSTRCFVGFVDGGPAVFVGVLQQPHGIAQNLRRVHRVVVLPDYQGLGLATRMMEIVASWAKAIGYRMLTHPAHPALVHTMAKSPKWKMLHAPDFTKPHKLPGLLATVTTWRRRVAAFEYVGPQWEDKLEARDIWGDDTLNRTGGRR